VFIRLEQTRYQIRFFVDPVDFLLIPFYHICHIEEETYAGGV
jgi:hypothetical protein